MASGLTRFSCEPDSFVVNSSQGGGFKDTWYYRIKQDEPPVLAGALSGKGLHNFKSDARYV